MGEEKHIKIDSKTGNPEYIDKDEGKKVRGLPDYDDLCFINFEPKKNKDIFEFKCVPTAKCKEINKETNKIKENLKQSCLKRLIKTKRENWEKLLGEFVSECLIRFYEIDDDGKPKLHVASEKDEFDLSAKELKDGKIRHVVCRSIEVPIPEKAKSK